MKNTNNNLNTVFEAMKSNEEYKRLAKEIIEASKDDYQICALIAHLEKDYTDDEISMTLVADGFDEYSRSTVNRRGTFGKTLIQDGDRLVSTLSKGKHPISWSNGYELYSLLHNKDAVLSAKANIWFNGLTENPTRDQIRKVGKDDVRTANTDEKPVKAEKSKDEIIAEIKALMTKYAITVEDLA